MQNKFSLDLNCGVPSLTWPPADLCYSDGLNLIPAWIGNHIPSIVLGKITYPPAPLKFGYGYVISFQTLPWM